MQILLTSNPIYVQTENKMCPWITVYIHVVQFIYNMSGQLLKIIEFINTPQHQTDEVQLLCPFAKEYECSYWYSSSFSKS